MKLYYIYLHINILQNGAKLAEVLELKNPIHRARGAATRIDLKYDDHQNEYNVLS